MTTIHATRSGRLSRLYAAVASAWVLGIAALAGLSPAGAAELLMFERQGCPFCARFERKIAPDYPQSAAGALAPLRRVDLADSRTGGIAGLDPAVFAPTFVLVEGSREIGRLVGYPGRRFFYAELQTLIDRLPRTAERAR
jgi:hypothetical protein